jgi:hypothetical protein
LWYDSEDGDYTHLLFLDESELMADKTIVIRGKLHWAKVLGPARPHTGLPKYDKGPYWSVDVTPDAASRELLKKMGVDGDKLKKAKSDKDTRKETFLSLKVLENKKDGGKNKSPVVKDIYGNIWNPEIELGNETVADVKISFVDYGDTQGLYLKAIRVLKHVPFERDDGFEELSEDDEYFAARDEEGSEGNDATGAAESSPASTSDTPSDQSNAGDASDEDDVPF